MYFRKKLEENYLIFEIIGEGFTNFEIFLKEKKIVKNFNFKFEVKKTDFLIPDNFWNYDGKIKIEKKKNFRKFKKFRK